MMTQELSRPFRWLPPALASRATMRLMLQGSFVANCIDLLLLRLTLTAFVLGSRGSWLRPSFKNPSHQSFGGCLLRRLRTLSVHSISPDPHRLPLPFHSLQDGQSLSACDRIPPAFPVGPEHQRRRQR